MVVHPFGGHGMGALGFGWWEAHAMDSGDGSEDEDLGV
jgi:hypothetical protein